MKLSIFQEFNDYIYSNSRTIEDSSGSLINLARQYVKERIRYVDVHAIASSADVLSGIEWQACEWAKDIDNNIFYVQLAQSLQDTGEINIPSLDITGKHSLSFYCFTWLVVQHPLFGELAILQCNYSFEALYIDRSKLLINCIGIGQQENLAFMLGLSAKQDFASYLLASPAYRGVNLNFSSPFHAICFGHTALMNLELVGINLYCNGYVNPPNSWFDAARMFPSVIRNSLPQDKIYEIVELNLDVPVFHVKFCHLYKTDESLNRLLDLVFLSASGASAGSIDLGENQDGLNIWLGLTSGKRSLENELSVILIFLKIVSNVSTIARIYVDGWTGSSMASLNDSESGLEPELYKGHADEYIQIEKKIMAHFPGIKCISLLGKSYEKKILVAAGCHLSLTSAYTASVVPSRICGLPGIVHTSNAGLGGLNMHIWRKALIVPPDIIFDHDVPPNQDPVDTSYEIVESKFEVWLIDALVHLIPSRFQC